MKKLSAIILAAVIINLGFAIIPKVYAGNANPNEELTEATFPVSDILRLPGGSGTAVDQPGAYSNDPKYSPIVSFILRIINFAMKIIGSIAIILFIIAGFMMMFAGGNQQNLDKAKDIFKYALIGLIVALLSYVITIFVQSLFVTTTTPQA